MLPAAIRILDASDDDTLVSAALALHDFNTEFDTPSPGPGVLAARLAQCIGDRMFVVSADDPRRHGDVIGLAVVSLRPNVWFDGPVALLDELYVRPHLRRRGIGSDLIAAVRHEATRRGAEYLEIAVDEGDVDARRFYERHGFSPVDPDSGDAALVYSGPLPPLDPPPHGPEPVGA